MIYQGDTAVYRESKAEYILSVMSFEYPVWTEKFAWTFWSFFANLGGNLGIWLSLDLIIFVELFYAAMKRLLPIMLKKLVSVVNRVSSAWVFFYNF